MRLVLVVTWLLGATTASANIFLTRLEPAVPVMGYGHTAFESLGPTQRIRFRNDGTPVEHLYTHVSGPFVIVATGGGLGTGEEQFWDVACMPSEPEPSQNGGYFDLDACAANCEDEWTDSIYLSCVPGLLDTPNAFTSTSFAYAYEPSTATLSFTNPDPLPITITSVRSNTPAFSASAALPVTLAMGESIDVVATFDTTGPDALGFIDVLAGTSIAGRVRLQGITLKQLDGWNFNRVPQGVTYTLPVRVRNSFPTARTIQSATSDLGEYTVTGLVGTTLAPGEYAHGLVTLNASTLGTRVGFVTVAFDTGQGDAGRFTADVSDPTFATTTSDGTPTDGRLDFGTLEVGAAPVTQTITIANLAAVDRQIVSCIDPIAPCERIGACPTVIAANGSIDLTFRCTPTTAGDVLDGAGVGLAGVGLIFVALSGRVIEHQLAYSTTALGFPDTPTAGASHLAVAITNAGSTPRTIAVAVTGAGFSTAASEITVPASGTVDVVVDFVPPSAGSFTGTLELGAPGDVDHATVTLTGIGLPGGGGSGSGGDGDGGGDDGHHGGCAAGSPGALAAFLVAGLWARTRRRRA